MLLGLAPAPPPKLNVEAPVAGAFAAGVFSAPPNPEKVEGAVVTAGAAADAPKLKVEAVVLAGAPKVKVELGADVVTGAPKAGGAPVDDPKVGAEVVEMLKLDLAVLPYAGGGAEDAVVEVGADEPNVNVEVAVEAGAEVVVEAPKVKVEPGAAGAAAPNVKVEVPVLGTLVVTEPNPDKLFGSVEVAAPNEKLGFEVEVDSEPKLKVVEAVVVAVEDVPNDVEGGDFVTDGVVLATLAVEVVEAAPNEKLGGCGLFVASGALKVRVGATLAVLSLSLSLPKLKLIIFLDHGQRGQLYTAMKNGFASILR